MAWAAQGEGLAQSTSGSQHPELFPHHWEGWLKGAHPCREVAAAPEALECRAGEEGAPEEQEGDEGDVGHVLAACPQKLPSLLQALAPAQPSGGCGRLQEQSGWQGGAMGTLGPQPLACLPESRGCTCWGASADGSGVLFPAEL